MVAARKLPGFEVIGLPPTMITWDEHQAIMDRYSKAIVRLNQTLDLYKAAHERLETWSRVPDADLHMRLQLMDALPIPTKRLKKQAGTGYIYVIQAEDTGLCKIGKSQSFVNRMDQFGVKLPFDWKAVCVLRFSDYDQRERKFHQDYKAQHVNGEWFKLEILDVLKIFRTGGAIERYFGEYFPPGTETIYTANLPAPNEDAIVLSA